MDQTESWKAFAQNPITHSAAHYLMTIEDLLENPGYARVTDVAGTLDVTKGAVSVNVQKLVERGLVSMDGKHFLGLTQTGVEIARRVRQNRKIFSRFLTEFLGVDAETAETDACKVEHLLSQETGEKLLAFMQFLLCAPRTTKKLLESFADYQFKCPQVEDCEVCDQVCLIHFPQDPAA